VIQTLNGEENYDAMKEAVMEILGQHFRPEFINRVDDAVVFHPLDQAEIRQIAEIQLGTLVKRLAERDMTISFSDEAMDLIAEAGFDSVYGARPLKRAIQQSVENPLANKILSGAFMGGDEIKVHVLEDQLVFDK
jgi:ATP-dependent Clp protease ATP-binding subunit ClpB